ncbi:MAG TPA: hypothetical protein VL485_02445, partial [Ktedonobacteraceae bacterium]|nr:hypothetical protein [Ktedonobacteraceae bacterium]
HQQRIDSRTVQRTRISHPSIVPPLASMQTDARTKGDGSDVKDEAQRPEELPARGLIPRVVVSSADAQQRKSVDLSISEPHGSVANSEQHDAHTSDHATVPASTARARQTQHLEIALPQKETGKLQVESEQPAVPIIRIHIGQVEVRAVPPAPPRQAPRRSEPPRQGLTLNEYMQQRRRDLQ